MTLPVTLSGIGFTTGSPLTGPYKRGGIIPCGLSSGNTYSSTFGVNYQAQSFTTGADNTLIYAISVFAFKNGAPAANLQCQLYATDVNGYPTGAVLGTATITAAAVPTIQNWLLFQFVGAGITVTPNTKYAAVFSSAGSTSGTNGYAIIFDYATQGAGYAGGVGLASTNSGTAWAPYTYSGFAGDWGITVSCNGTGNDAYYLLGRSDASLTTLVVQKALDPTADPTTVYLTTGTSPSGGQFVGGSATTLKLSQSFTTTTSVLLRRITVGLQKQGAPGDNVIVDLFAADVNGFPTGNSLATALPQFAGSLTTAIVDYDMAFKTPVQLVAATQYCLVMTRSGSTDSSNDAAWGQGGTFAGGIGAQWTSAGGWVSVAFDFRLKIMQPEPWGNVATQGGFQANVNSFATYQQGNVLHTAIWHGATNSSYYSYLAFDMASDAVLVNETIASAIQPSGQQGSQSNNISIVVRSTGEVVVLYNGTQTKTSGTFYARVYYSRRTAPNTWSAAVQVDASTAFDANFPVLILGASDAVHCHWRTSAPTTNQRTLSAANALQTASTPQGTVSYVPAHGISYPVAATTHCVLMCSSGPAFVYTSANTPTWTLSAVMPGDTMRMFNDAGDSNHQWMLYRKSTDSDLYVYDSINEWSSYGTEKSVMSGITAISGCMSNNSVMFQRGNAITFGFAVNDNNVALKYNEYVVRYVSTADAWDANNRSDAANAVLSNNDKTVTLTGSISAVSSTTGHTLGAAGRYYAGFKLETVGNQYYFGLQPTSSAVSTLNAGVQINSGGAVSYLGADTGVRIGSISNGDVVNIAWDASAKLIWLRRNGGLWNGSAGADPATGSGGISMSTGATVSWELWVYNNGSMGTTVVTVRTELADLIYAGPVGFTSWMGEVIPTADAWSAADKSSNITLSNADKTAALSTSLNGAVRSTRAVSGGKFYGELLVGDMSGGPPHGIKLNSLPVIGVSGDVIYVNNTGSLFVAGTNVGSITAPPLTGHVISWAWDDVAKLVWARYDSDAWGPSGDPSTGTGGASTSALAAGDYSLWFGGNQNVNSCTIRTEKAEFTKPTPSGFLSWMGETLVIPDAGTLVPGSSSVAGSGVATHQGTGTLTAQVAGLTSNQAISSSTGTGVLTSANPTLIGTGTAAWNATGVLSPAIAALSGSGLVTTPPAFGTGVLTSTVTSLVANGVSGSVGTSVLTQSVAPKLTGVGVSSVVFTAALSASTSTLAAVGVSGAVQTSAALAPSPSSTQGVGQSSSRSTSATLVDVASTVVGLGTGGVATGTGTLAATTAALIATGDVITPPAIGTGVLTATVAALTGAGLPRWIATGTLPSAVATAAGVGVSQVVASGVLAPSVATLAGSGTAAFIPRTGDGVLACSISTLASFGTVQSTGTGVLTPTVSTVSGAGKSSVTFSAAISATAAAMVAPGLSTSTGPGILQAQTNFLRMGDGLSSSIRHRRSDVGGDRLASSGVSSSAGSGVLPGTISTVAGAGQTFVGVTGVGNLTSIATLAGAGISKSSSTSGVLTGTVSTMVAPGIAFSLGTGVLPRTTATSTLAGLGVAAHLATGVLTDQVSILTSAGLARWVGSGALATSGCALSGSGQVSFAAIGTLAASVAQVSGAGVSSSRVVSAPLQASVVVLIGTEGVVTIAGTGSMPSQSAQLDGAGRQTSLGTGVLVGPAAALAGAGLSRAAGTGSLLSQACVLAALGKSSVTGTGVLALTGSELTGTGTVAAGVLGTGILLSGPAQTSGTGVRAVDRHRGAPSTGFEARPLQAPRAGSARAPWRGRVRYWQAPGRRAGARRARWFRPRRPWSAPAYRPRW